MELNPETITTGGLKLTFDKDGGNLRACSVLSDQKDTKEGHVGGPEAGADIATMSEEEEEHEEEIEYTQSIHTNAGGDDCGAEAYLQGESS